MIKTDVVIIGAGPTYVGTSFGFEIAQQQNKKQ